MRNEAFPSDTMIGHHVAMLKRMTVTRSSRIFVDDRGADRVLRVNWHPEHRMAVLSVWRGEQCVSTFRLPAADVPALVHTLTDGLAELATTTATTEYRDQMASELLVEPAVATPPARPQPETLASMATRGLNTLIDGCVRLRERINRR